MIAPVIVGGGLAGAAAACLLGQAGWRATLLEGRAGPQHKICGEFISGEAVDFLRALGVDPLAHGAAQIGAMRLIHRGRVAESRLPFRSAGLSRFVLDELLLRRAAALGAALHRGVRVRRAEPGRLQTDGGEVAAATVFLATGKQDLRGAERALRRPPDALIGLKLHLRLRPAQQDALRGFVEVVMFEGGYAGLQLVESGIANLCLLIQRDRYEPGATQWPGLQALLEGCDRHFGRRLEGASPCAERSLSIYRVPYGFVHRGKDAAGVFRLGDQAAVIPSFCGDGMAMALHSARLAAATWLGGGDARAYHRRMRRDCAPPVRLARGLYRLGQSSLMREVILETARLWPGFVGTVARNTRVAAPAG